MDEWFQVHSLDAMTYVISEPRHYEETNCYLLLGNDRALLIDSGLGIANIRKITDRLTTLPVTVIATHVHWDHIGSHGSFDRVLVHTLEQNWLEKEFPLPPVVVRNQLMKEPCIFPADFQADTYAVWQGKADGIVNAGDILDLGGRHILVYHTPGHAPGHMCFLDIEREWLYSGDLIYKGMLYCDYPSTDPQAYLHSVQHMRKLAVKRLLPAHHSIDVDVELIQKTAAAWEALQEQGLLHHGSGEFQYGDFSIRL